jgi:hypothetical protein
VRGDACAVGRAQRRVASRPATGYGVPLKSPANTLEVAMAKGQMRSNKEKKKPKQDKNKKKGGAAPPPSPFANMHSQAKPGANAYGKKS